MSQKEKPVSGIETSVMAGSPPAENDRITLENWDQPPYNRWSFQHIREVLPTANVSRGNETASEFKESKKDFDNLPVKHSRDGRDSTVMKTLLDTYTDGFMVLHNNEIIYERYLNNMSVSSMHLSQSVAKSVTATVCGILIHRGEIDRDALIGDLIPELANSAYGDATLSQVLDMRSGVRFGEDYTDPHSDVGKMDVASGWKSMKESFPTSILDLPITLVKEREHGGSFLYRSIETDVMAWVMEKATGKRLPQIVSEELWQKLGVDNDAYYTVDRGGYAMASGGFNATLRDYARVGLLYANDGKVGDSQLLPANWVRETLQDGDMDAFKSYRGLDLPRGAYKNQWWVRDVSRQQIMARGVFGQTIYVDKLNDIVVVGLSTWPDFDSLDFTNDELDIIDVITTEILMP